MTYCYSEYFCTLTTNQLPSAEQVGHKLISSPQKWVAMTGTHHVEPCTEWRRTGYPDFLTLSLDTQIGNAFPDRLLYPSSEETRDPNVPAQRTIKDRVWWDVK